MGEVRVCWGAMTSQHDEERRGSGEAGSGCESKFVRRGN